MPDSPAGGPDDGRAGRASDGGSAMRALETIGLSLVVIIFTVGLLLHLIGGTHYQRK
jgi:hypothetical protein